MTLAPRTRTSVLKLPSWIPQVVAEPLNRGFVRLTRLFERQDHGEDDDHSTGTRPPRASAPSADELASFDAHFGDGREPTVSELDELERRGLAREEFGAASRPSFDLVAPSSETSDWKEPEPVDGSPESFGGEMAQRMLRNVTGGTPDSSR